MGHPNLSPAINAHLAQSEKDGGVWLSVPPASASNGESVLRVGQILEVQTQNTLYEIVKSDKGYMIRGHAKYCPEWTRAGIHGSTWGGSMLKMGYVGVGMYLEFSVEGHREVTTSQIKEVWIK